MGFMIPTKSAVRQLNTHDWLFRALSCDDDDMARMRTDRDSGQYKLVVGRGSVIDSGMVQ